MVSRLAHSCVITLIAALVMLSNLGGARLWDRDEPRNAGCAAEMLARGDWIVPVFNAEQRTHKPVLLYWLIMASYVTFGVNEFAARFPSALMAIGTALCTCEMGRRLFSPKVGFWSGLVLPTSLMFVVAGRAATPDSALIFFSTLAITLFVVSAFEDGSLMRRQGAADKSTGGDPLHTGICCDADNLSWGRWAAVYAATGFGVLAKGPVGIVLPMAVIGMFLLIVRQKKKVEEADGFQWRQRALRLVSFFEPRHFLRTLWSMRPMTAIAICLAVAAPWYVWVGIRTDGEFLRGFFLEHNLSRAMQSMEGHRGNVFYYPLAVLAGFFPWSVFAVPILIDSIVRYRQGHRWNTSYVFIACWVGVYLGLFSVARTKLPSYVTPCYPALALAAGVFIDRWLAGECHASRRWRFAAIGVLILVGIGFSIGVPIALQPVLPSEQWLGVIGLTLVAAGIYCLWCLAKDEHSRVAITLVTCSAAWVILVSGLAAARISRHQQQDRLWSAIRANSSSPRIAAFACLEPSWVFYSGLPIDELSHGSIGPTHRPWIYDGQSWRPKGRIEVDEFVADHPEPFVLTTAEKLEQVKQLLPADFQEIESVPFFLKDDRLIVLGRTNVAPARHRHALRESRQR